MQKYGTTYFHAVDADGVRKVHGAMTSVDPMEDHHLMTSFLMFHQAVNRGIVFDGRKLGNLYLSSTPPAGMPTVELTPAQQAHIDRQGERNVLVHTGTVKGMGKTGGEHIGNNLPKTHSMGYRVELNNGKKPRFNPVFEVSMLEPDANCVTAADGSCVATGPCMHGAGVDPVATHGTLTRLTDQLNDLAQAVLGGDGDHAMQLIQRLAHDDHRVAETLARLTDSGELDDVDPLTCDVCGTPTPDPYHFTGILNGVASRHIHVCDAHNDALPVIQVEGTTVLGLTTTFADWEELEGHRRMKNELACLFDHDDEPRWKWILQTARSLKEARDLATNLMITSLEYVQPGHPDANTNLLLMSFRDNVRKWLRFNVPTLFAFRCWPDGTVQQVETSADGLAEESPTYMSDDYTVVHAPHEQAATRMFNELQAKAQQGAAKC